MKVETLKAQITGWKQIHFFNGPRNGGHRDVTHHVGPFPTREMAQHYADHFYGDKRPGYAMVNTYEAEEFESYLYYSQHLPGEIGASKVIWSDYRYMTYFCGIKRVHEIYKSEVEPKIEKEEI